MPSRERYDWIDLFTPVNEIFIDGSRAFVTALKHLCMANIRAEEEILRVCPQAIFIQSEATSFYQERSPRAMAQAGFENEKRFLSLDLSYGHAVQSNVYELLLDNGMSREEISLVPGTRRPHASTLYYGHRLLYAGRALGGSRRWDRPRGIHLRLFRSGQAVFRPVSCADHAHCAKITVT